MKKILLIILLAAAAIPFQNCGDTPTPVPKDTTPVVKPEPVNTFKFNWISTYNLKWDSNNKFANYKASENLTTVIVEGYSSGKWASFTLKFPGNKTGTFKHSTVPEVDMEVETGEGVMYKDYLFSTKPGADITINITKFDGIGGRIKGTFSGDLQESTSITTATISAGAFEARVE